MTGKHLSIGAGTLLAPVPLILLSCACKAAALAEIQQKEPDLFAQDLAPGLGALSERLKASAPQADAERYLSTISTIAWTGVVSSQPPRLALSVRKSRLSYPLLAVGKQAMVHPVNELLLKSADYCGVKSGRDEDKFAACGLEFYERPDYPGVKILSDAPLTIACTVEQVLSLDSHELFICSIDDVLVRADLLNAQNKLELERANLVAYAHGSYYALADALGFFGYSVAVPEVLKRRMPRRGSRRR